MAQSLDNALTQLGVNSDAFRAALGVASDVIALADQTGRITFANSAALDFFGVTLIGAHLETLFMLPGESTDACIAQAMEGEEQRRHAVIRRQDGDRRHVILRIAPVSPTVQGVVVAIRDITDEQRARDAVSKSEARYHNVFEAASDAIYTLDRSGTFTSVNEATCRLTGYAREEIVGHSLLPLLETTEIPMLTERFRTARDGEPTQFECNFTSKQGTLLLLSVTNAPIRSGNEIIGVLGIARNVTEQRRAAHEREELRRQLLQSQKLEAIGQLVSGVAHEINNPLAAVMAYAQLVLQNAQLSPDDTQALETIVQETRRAAKIVSNLLTFARRHQPERAVTDINQIVRDTVALRRFAFADNAIALTVDLDEELPLTWADNFQIQQVLLNLITNAEQALIKWPGQRNLLISTRYRDNAISLTVADTGPGISAEVAEQIFNPFFTTKSVGEGTGLGLAISDGIIREHGGTIVVSATPGGGASFAVQLPYIDPAAAFLERSPNGQGKRSFVTGRS